LLQLKQVCDWLLELQSKELTNLGFWRLLFCYCLGASGLLQGQTPKGCPATTTSITP
jgi:hypothetical protein